MQWNVMVLHKWRTVGPSKPAMLQMPGEPEVMGLYQYLVCSPLSRCTWTQVIFGLNGGVCERVYRCEAQVFDGRG